MRVAGDREQDGPIASSSGSSVTHELTDGAQIDSGHHKSRGQSTPVAIPDASLTRSAPIRMTIHQRPAATTELSAEETEPLLLLRNIGFAAGGFDHL
jgi:hypothetical protein